MSLFAGRLAKRDMRALLLAVAAVLLFANVARLLYEARQAMVVDIEGKVARLAAARRQQASLAGLAAGRRKLESLAAGVEKRLFSGEGEEEVASAMQIRLQQMVSASGVESESIRPVPAALKPGEKEGPIIPMVVKMRLTGTMSTFLAFMKRLYDDEKFFRVEKLTIRPFRKAGLKIYLEIRGYYSFNPGCGSGGIGEKKG